MLVGGGSGNEALAEVTKPGLKRGFESIVNPGELSKAHRIKEIQDCTKCHEYYGEIPESKCFACHKIIQKRREAGAGYHGKKRDKCIHCHKEHPSAAGSIINFDKDKFDHTAAVFPLEGKHKDVKCEKCHTRKASEDGGNPAGYYVGLRHASCLDCHKDVHKGGFGEKKCETCHSTAGWKGDDLKFAHDRDAKFKLEGKHRTVKCVKCHKATTKDGSLYVASFKTKHASCADCHKDPHRGEIKRSCAACHTANDWRNTLTFDHGRDTDYRLEGKHRSVKCVKCHRTGKKDGLLDVTSFRIDKYGLCAPCHKHKHKGTFIVTCDTCHTFDTWKRQVVLSPY
jgi:hypothetical protein